ncbi:hypothetical protein V8E36_008390 [Tilletia maclaganii]
MYPAPGLASLPSPSTLFLSSSESSGPEDPAWSESVQQINKTTGLLGRLLDPATTTSGITSTPPPPLAASSPSTATTPSPVRIHLASPAPVIPLFPGVTTPSSAPLFAPHVRVRNPAENDEATFFDVFAPEVDTPSPIRLTRRLTFPSLPTLPVTSMSMTWNMPHVVLEEEEDLASSFSPSRRASDFGPGRRPLGSPIALLRGRNLSDLSLAEVSSAQQQHAHPPASFLEPGRPASIVSCHTFGHHSSQNSASLQVLYDRSPSPAVSGCVTPVGGGNNLAPDAASSFMTSLLHALNSYMIRSPQDSPACGGERPRRRRGSQSNSKLQARLGGGGPRRPVPPVPAMRRSLPLLQPTTTRSPADSERSAYADVSDYDDGFSPRATTTTLSPPGEPIRLANGRINPRRRYSHEPLQVLTTTASCNEAAGAGATGLVVMAVNLTRADSSSSRAGERRLASSAMMVQPVPKRNASMAELGPRASGGGGGPVIPSRSSSSSLVVVARAAALSSSSLEQQLSPPLTAASSLPIPQISVSASTPVVHQEAVFLPPPPPSAAAGRPKDSDGPIPMQQHIGHKVRSWTRSVVQESSPAPAAGPVVPPLSPPTSIVEPQCAAGLRRSSSALSLLRLLDPIKTSGSGGGGGVREREREREAIMPIAIISRANSLVLDREEAEMREGLGRVGWDGEAKDEVGGWRKSVGDGREDGDGDGESRVQTRTGPRPKGMVSMQDALAMGPQLVLVRDPVDSAAAAAAAERERSGVSSTMGEIRKGWMGVPAALRSVRSLASFTSAVGGGGAKTTPRRPHFAASSKPAPLLTPPEETTKPQLRPAINYNMMLGVAGALLAASGPRQRSRSTSAPLGARSGLADEVKGGAKQAVTPAVFVPHAHELQGILLNRSVAQLPATPPREPNVAATTTAKEGGQTAEPFLGLGPAFSTPSPATASAAGVVRDIAWAGRPDLITDQHSLTSHGGRGSGSGSNGLPALSETPEGLRRAFWNEDDERGEQSRFRRIPPRSQSSLGLLQQPRSGEDHSTPSPSLARRRSIGTPPRTASTMATLSSTQRFERDQYAWLRMQEASPTLPSCDLPRRGKETVSTIPFPRASPINIKHGGGGQLPAVMRGSPGRASRQSVTDAASALVYSLQRASSSGSGSSRSGSLTDDGGGAAEEHLASASDSDSCKTPSPSSALRTVPLPLSLSSPGSRKTDGASARYRALEAWLQWTD